MEQKKFETSQKMEQLQFYENRRIYFFYASRITYNSSCIVNVLNSCHGNFQAPKYASAAHIFFTVAIHFLSCVKQRMLSKMGCGQKIVKLHNRGSSQPPAVNPFTVLSSLTHGLKSFFESETLVLTSYFHLLSNCRFFKVYHNILRLLMGRFSFTCHKICVEIYSD